MHAVHFLFENRMMLWKMEFGLDGAMAFETGLRTLARVYDKFAAATPAGDMQTAGTMARFATGRAGWGIMKMNRGVRACRKHPANVCVALGAGSIANESGARHFGGHVECQRFRRTGV